jgi:type I restriction enzyme M protein
MAFESSFKAIDNTLHHDDGCSTALDYVEQSSWVLFLKYLDDLELTREQAAELESKAYTRIISGEYQWHEWALPLDAQGNYDRARALVGDDLIEFVNQKLFPYLQGFKERFPADTIEYKVGVIFTEIKNKISSGYNLRDVIERIDELKFQTADNRHEMTQIYEDRLRQMGNAGRNGGEYYTPRPLIWTIVKSVSPQVGETVYDGACGSAGFLCEAYTYMHSKPGLTSSEEEILQTKTFYGKELKGLAYIIAMMNMILHGVQSPNIVRTNTLSENLANIQPSDQKNVVLANPPFGGSEREEVQQNFPIRSSETAYMFLQHFIKMMKAGGRAGIVIKNTFLSNGDATALRRKLLEECNLHTVLDLPSGVFTGAGVKTVVLFFTKGEPTQKIWYYQIDKHYTKTQPLTEADLEDFLAKQKTREDSECSWSLNVSDLGDDLDLSVKNPHKVEEVDERTPAEIFSSIEKLRSEADKILEDALVWDLWPDDGKEGEDLFAEPIPYDDEEEFLDFDYEALSPENKKKIDALDEQIAVLEKKLKEIKKPYNEQIDALLDQKETIYKENSK